MLHIKPRLRGVLFFCCLAGGMLTSQAQQTVTLEGQSNLIHLGEQVLYLEDPSNKLTIEEVKSWEFKSRFKICGQSIPNFQSTASAYWINLKLRKSTIDNYYVEIGTAFMDSISLYQVNSDGEVLSVRYSGDDLPFEDREIQVGNYLFKLNLPSNGDVSEFYLRIKSNQPLFFPLRAGTLVAFMSYTHDLDFVQGLYFGFMLLIFLYNLFIYISIREKVYLLYIGYVISITFFMAAVFGYFFEYLWPNSPWINQQVVMFTGLTLVTATLFTQHFLNTKVTHPLLHKIAFTFLVSGLAVTLMVPIGFKIAAVMLSQVALLLMSVYFLFLGIFYFTRGYTPAKFYLLAWGCLVIGIFFGMLESLNIIPVVPYINPMQLGSAAEVMLLSFALGDRINTYKRQREEATALALLTAQEHEKLVLEQNEILEQKVDERTTKIRKQNAELISLNKEKNNLLSIVSHDLRNPLNQIKGLVHLTKLESPQMDQAQQDNLNRIMATSERLTKMIRRILDLSTIEFKDVNIELSAVDIGKLLSDIIKDFEIDAAEKNIRIIREFNAGPYLAKVDKTYLIQVLENLISNAIKFSVHGKQVNLDLRGEGKKLQIIIKDEGPGFTQDDMRKLFGKFQKLSAKPTGNETSLGLGLSIVKRYVEAMHGTISCESQEGVGATFIVSFDKVEA